MIAIGLDPSLTGFGWAVLFGQRLDACGVWRTERDVEGAELVADDNASRVWSLASQLAEVLHREQTRGQELDIEVGVFVERLGTFLKRSSKASATMQGRVLGIVEGACAALGLPLREIDPQHVKRLANSGKVREVSKEEVRDRIFQLYPNARDLVPLTKVGTNASDAIAIAHCGQARAAFNAALSPNVEGGSW